MRYEAIENWLEKFKTLWIEKNVQGITDLFDGAVQYWETPFICLDGKDAIVQEWQAINAQEGIKIETELMAMDAERSTVKWNLEYTKEANQYIWAGIYVIDLNSEGKCTYFLQVGEAQS